MNEHNETLGARIAQRRAELGLTLQQVADAAQVTRSTVQRYEQDAFETPQRVTVTALAAALHVSPAWLLGRTDEKVPAAPTVSDEQLKFALFGGDGDISDAQFAEVKRFAQFVKERDKIDGK